MENVSDSEGGSVAHGELTASADLKEELVRSLTSFSRVYRQHRDRLQRASENFTRMAASLPDVQEDSSEKAKMSSFLSVIGGFVGAACGGLTGGVGGILGGAVGAATYIDTNSVGATLGFIGSVLGGVAGGAVSGAVGGSVCASAKATGSPIHGVVSYVACLTLGCATGSAVGGIFGGMVGAVGGVYGAFCATMATVKSVGFVFDYFCEAMMEESVDFCKNIKPLVDELKTIKTISDKMASSSVVRGVAGQTAKTLTSVASMVIDSRSASDLPKFVSSFEEAAKQSKTITEDMEEMSAEVEKLLLSLRQ